MASRVCQPEVDCFGCRRLPTPMEMCAQGPTVPTGAAMSATRLLWSRTCRNGECRMVGPLDASHTPHQIHPGGLKACDGDLALLVQVVRRLEVHEGEQGVGEHLVVAVNSRFFQEG